MIAIEWLFSAVFVCTNIFVWLKNIRARYFTQCLHVEIQMVPPDLFIVKHKKRLLSEIIE